MIVTWENVLFWGRERRGGERWGSAYDELQNWFCFKKNCSFLTKGIWQKPKLRLSTNTVTLFAETGIWNDYNYISDFYKIEKTGHVEISQTLVFPHSNVILCNSFRVNFLQIKTVQIRFGAMVWKLLVWSNNSTSI